MSLLTKLKYLNINPYNRNCISTSTRFANKKIDPFSEKLNRKNIEEKEINTNNKKSSEIKAKKKFNFFDMFLISIGLGLSGYLIYKLKKKREESISLDKMNVKKLIKKIKKNIARQYLHRKKRNKQ